MSQKSSTFIKETRDREAWLKPAAQREGGGEADGEKLVAAAALLRGTAQAIPVPEDAEERSRARAVAHLQETHLERRRQCAPVAPWYLRLGRFMRYVFTLGRRR
jgi:hypothetical protein